MARETPKTSIRAWSAHFPRLTSHAQRWLVRRHETLVCGIYLEKTSRPDQVLPMVFFHNLARPFPTLSLTASAPLTGPRALPAPVKMADLEASRAAADSLAKAHAWLSREGLAIADVEAHVRAYLDGKLGRVAPFQAAPYELAIYARAALGDAEGAAAAISSAFAEIAAWPERAFNVIGSPDAWRERVEHETALRDGLLEVANREAVTLQISAIENRPLRRL